jgi:hypothetical protein
MKILSVTLAFTLAALASSAGAEDAPGYKTWGQCIAAMSQFSNDDWKSSRTSNGRGSGFGVPMYDLKVYCAKIGDFWYLVPRR